MTIATIKKKIDQDALVYKNCLFLVDVSGCYGLNNQIAVSW